MELTQIEDCQKRKTNKAPVATDKLYYLSLHDSGTLPQMNGAQSLNKWDGWKLKCFGRSFELPCQRFLWRPSQWEKTPTLDEATSSDCACGVLASLDHPKSSVLTGNDRHSLLEYSLPVASVLVEFFPSLERHQSCVLLTKTPAKTQNHPWVDVSQPSLRTLTTGSERSNRERLSLPVRTLFILIAPFFNTFWIPKSLPVVSVLRAPHWQNSQFTTGSERSKGSPLTEFPIHYR